MAQVAPLSIRLCHYLTGNLRNLRKIRVKTLDAVGARVRDVPASTLREARSVRLWLFWCVTGSASILHSSSALIQRRLAACTIQYHDQASEGCRATARVEPHVGSRTLCRPANTVLNSKGRQLEAALQKIFRVTHARWRPRYALQAKIWFWHSPLWLALREIVDLRLARLAGG